MDARSAPAERTPVRIGVLGLGTVGQALLRLLAASQSRIERRIGRRLAVTHVALRDPQRRRDCDLSAVALSTDPRAVVTADVDVVVELIGGISPARELVLAALAAGKAVVTANKALLAESGGEIFSAAEIAGQPLGFEAAVGGGIPIIKALREGLAANRIDEIAGIINGTSNYILTEMSRRGIAFEVALGRAQRLGYAEADPRFDVDGIDAAHKLAILAAIAFATPPDFAAIQRDGLARVHPDDIRLAGELGYRIKPLAIAKRHGGGLELRVHPTLVPHAHPLALVDGSVNAVRVKGDAVGQTLYIGRGAGGLPTASAVLADLIEIARTRGCAAVLPPALGWPQASLAPLPVLPTAATVSSFYLRLRVADTPGVLRAITAHLAEAEISVEAILQKEPEAGADAQLAIITSAVTAADFEQALAQIRALDFVRPDHSCLRVEHFDD
ncbi:MAG: homoserine dehydrogenase [Gammaproteobacteria bacterium]|nr:homoserine dehydrogenase [Gammaproteobacteria bacterium]